MNACARARRISARHGDTSFISGELGLKVGMGDKYRPVNLCLQPQLLFMKIVPESTLPATLLGRQLRSYPTACGEIALGRGLKRRICTGEIQEINATVTYL